MFVAQKTEQETLFGIAQLVALYTAWTVVTYRLLPIVGCQAFSVPEGYHKV